MKLSLRLINSLLVWCFLGTAGLSAQKLPAPPNVQLAQTLGSDWLVLSGNGSLEPFNPEQHQEVRALHQWVRLHSQQPFVVSFTARKGLCIFLNNRLVYKAGKTGKASINLSDAPFFAPYSLQQVLLTIWHPQVLPNYLSFNSQSADVIQIAAPDRHAGVQPVPKKKNYESTYIFFILLIGLLYSYLRVQYASDWATLFGNAVFARQHSADEYFNKRPVLSAGSMLFLLAFSLSVSLVTVVIKRNLHDTIVLHQTFEQTQAGIAFSVLVGTLVVLVAMLGKYVFVNFAGYIFNFQQLAPVQYREFIRYSLLFGFCFPVLLLLYLSIGTENQERLLLVANMVLMLLLVAPVLRIFYLMSSKYKLGSIQLICYLCATEVIPLAIILKITFLSY